MADTAGPAYTIADPICTVLFSILVLFTTVGTIKNALRVVLMGAPKGFDTEGLAERLKSLDGVESIHGGCLVLVILVIYWRYW